MDAPLKVLIADDHPLILQGIRRALDGSPDMDVVGEARGGEELLALVDRRNPDVVLLDLNMPGKDGLECVAELQRTHPGVKSVVLSASEDRATIDAALEAGASAYVIKSVNLADIPAALRQAASGAIFHAPSAGPKPGEPSAPAPSGPDLTERERAILAAVASGMTTKAISQELWLSEHTVKFHLTNIYRKLGVANRSAAVRYAFEHGLAGAPAA
ncbi:MAG TPA: response regulator transcription factor [Solirubrobacteraceae bacterium]|nr:response regulator transcription factor [Solirubrobacteraceae bacterium]